MANVASAEKRNRQRLKRRARNLIHLGSARTSVKRAMAALSAKDPAGSARDAVEKAITRLDKAAQRGVIKRKTASRKISRLARALNKQAAK